MNAEQAGTLIDLFSAERGADLKWRMRCAACGEGTVTLTQIGADEFDAVCSTRGCSEGAIRRAALAELRARNGTQTNGAKPPEKPPPEEPRLWPKLLTFQQLLDLPPPVWQVDDLFFEQSLVEFYGQPNHGKTFVVMDIAMMIRRRVGSMWCGRAVNKAGAVIYVNADGGPGFGDRARAWSALNAEVDADFEFYTYPEPINLNRPQDMIEFRAMLAYMDTAPAFVVFDTYSRCIPGVDENQQADASLVVQQIDRIKLEFGATIGLLHHTDKEGIKSRGSSVILGAVDTQILIEKKGENHLTVVCKKQRDGRYFAPLNFSLERVPGTNHVWPLYTPLAGDETGDKRENVEGVLSTIAACPGITRGEICAALNLTEPTLRRYLKPYLERGVVSESVRMRKPGDEMDHRPPRGLFFNEKYRE